MKTRGRAAARRERGQNLVEFALVLPVIMILMVGGYNLGVLFLRITDASYIAQSGAATAARYGGDTTALQESINQQVQGSFLSGDSTNFSWHVETRTSDGSTVCAPSESRANGRLRCTCTWGQQVAVVTSYQWKFDALFYVFQGTYQTQKTALCWRGGTPGG